jgi:hypothetical protein
MRLQSIQLDRWLNGALTKSPTFEFAIVRVTQPGEREMLVVPVLYDKPGKVRLDRRPSPLLAVTDRRGRCGQIRRVGSREASRPVLIGSWIAEHM